MKCEIKNCNNEAKHLVVIYYTDKDYDLEEDAIYICDKHYNKLRSCLK